MWRQYHEIKIMDEHKMCDKRKKTIVRGKKINVGVTATFFVSIFRITFLWMAIPMNNQNQKNLFLKLNP